MNSIELLELAAEAAKIKKYGDIFYDMEYDKEWHPLGDDGDAHRLAVKLGMCVESFPGRRSYTRSASTGNSGA